MAEALPMTRVPRAPAPSGARGVKGDMRTEGSSVARAGVRRAALLSILIALLVTGSAPAIAGPTGQLKSDKQHLAQIKKRLKQRQATLVKLDKQLATIAQQITATQDRLVQTE